jgi:hypothetical protein
MSTNFPWLQHFFSALVPFTLSHRTADAFEENRIKLEELRQLHPDKTLEDLKGMMETYLERNSLRSRIAGKITRLKAKISSANVRRKLHKWIFTLNFLRLLGEFFLLGREPCWYPAWHIFWAVVFLSSRIVYFRMLKYHYFLLDFCYYANSVLLLYLWKYPDSEWLGCAAWGYSFGSLLFSVPLYTNMIVLHNIDKTTTNFIHIAPAITLWAVRWSNCSDYWIAHNTPAFLLYLLWAVLYYFLIFVFTFKRCQAKQNLTLYTWMLSDTSAWPYQVSGVLGERLRPLVFMAVHLMVFSIGLIVSYLCLVSFVFCTGFAMGIGFICVWNAASYYMDYFAKDYEKRLQELKDLEKQQ